MTDNNKYYKWYNQIIDRARNRTILGYVERHHIVPRSLGGTNEKSNLVDLTAREHLVAHMLLPRFVENKAPMWNAVYMMMNTQGRKLTGKLYEQARIEYRGICKSRKRSPETCAKMSAALKGRKSSPETCAKMSAARKGKKRSPETCAKISAAKKGRKRSPEFCAKVAAALKGKKISPETIAKRQATRAANRALKPLQCTSECYHQSPVQLS